MSRTFEITRTPTKFREIFSNFSEIIPQNFRGYLVFQRFIANGLTT